ncbi:hypothetical protein BDR03DRAFT_1035480 [Suillus americanus]|nr:hypothetical protein BDR03DRAFT_1035480 [Suillus americanus]
MCQLTQPYKAREHGKNMMSAVVFDENAYDSSVLSSLDNGSSVHHVSTARTTVTTREVASQAPTQKKILHLELTFKRREKSMNEIALIRGTRLLITGSHDKSLRVRGIWTWGNKWAVEQLKCSSNPGFLV